MPARAALIVILAALVGCATSNPVAYVGPQGRYGTGSLTMDGTLRNGTFSISDGKTTCSGSIPNWSPLTVVFPVKCSDGRSGSVTLTRPFEGKLSGQGTMLLSDGQSRQVVYAAAAD